MGELAALGREELRLSRAADAVEAQAASWEAERRARVARRQAELDELLRGQRGGGAVDVHGGDAVADDSVLRGNEAGGNAPTAAEGAGEEQSVGDAQAAQQAASATLRARTDALSEELAANQRRVHGALAAVQAATEAVMAAEAVVVREEAKASAATARQAALRATAKAWGWDASRAKAARAMAAVGAERRRDVLFALATEAGLDTPLWDATAVASTAPAMSEEANGAQPGLDGVAVSEGAAAAIVRGLKASALAMRAAALASRHRVDDISMPVAPAGTHTARDGAGGSDGSAASDADGGMRVCSSCGQSVAVEHLHAHHRELQAELAAAEAAAAASEAAHRRGQAAADGERVALLAAQLRASERDAATARAAHEEAEAARHAQHSVLAEQRAHVASLESKARAANAAARAELASLTEVERRATAHVASVAARAAERAQQAALDELRVTHASEAVDAAAAEANPHELRRADAKDCLEELAGRRASLEAEEAAAATRQARLREPRLPHASCTSNRSCARPPPTSPSPTHSSVTTVVPVWQAHLAELQEHFGKRGVQNMLYTLALAQLEALAHARTGGSHGRAWASMRPHRALLTFQRAHRIACTPGRGRQRATRASSAVDGFASA